MTESGEISNMVYQIASETCGWFRFNLIGSAEVSLTSSSDLNTENIQDLQGLARINHSSKGTIKFRGVL